MGLFSSRMTDAELAKAKGQARSANREQRLAMDAINSGNTRADRARARQELARLKGSQAAADKAIKATEKNVRSWW
jgi:hypothetical protein